MVRTEDVRDTYVYNSESNQWPGATVRREREFDEWLAEVDNEGFWRGYRLAVLHMTQREETHDRDQDG